VVFPVELTNESEVNEAVLLPEFSDICIDELSRFELAVEEYE
jgi:hypothetical protein